MQENQISVTSKINSALNQHRLAVAVKFSVVAIVVVAFYLQDLNMVFTGAITNEATYHILAIPFLFGYLVYRKRKMINASVQENISVSSGFQKYSSMLAGVSLCAIAVFTYWWGSYTFTPLEYHMLTMPFLIAGLLLLLFNVQTLKELLFPVAFLFFLTPPPDEILYGWGSSLSNVSASASNSLANLFGLHSSLSVGNAGPIITILTANRSSLSFNVDVACSGIYSIIGFVIFAVFVAYITRGPLWSKIAILAMGIPLILALNVIRITTILGIGYGFGENLALTLFHDVGATVLMFIGVLVLLVITDRVFPKPPSVPPCPACNPTPQKTTGPFCSSCGKLFKAPKIKLTKADIAKIIGIALVTIMLLSIQAPVFALTKGPVQLTTITPSGSQINTSASMLPNIKGYTVNYVYEDTAFEQESGDNEALVYAYNPPNSTDPSVWVAIQIADSVISEHRWETCLINFPLSQGDALSVNQLDLRDIQLQANPPMTARYFAFQYKDTNQTQVVLYWYETAVFNSNSTAITQSVMISLIMYLSSTQNVTAAENQELPIAQAINNYWQPIQTWSAVALALSENGLALSIAACTILAVIIIITVFYDRRDKKLLLNLYSKLPESSKNIVKAVANAQKQGNPTIDGIKAEIQKLTQMSVDENWLTGKLSEAENAGLVKKVVANKNDDPTIQWKNQLPQNKSVF